MQLDLAARRGAGRHINNKRRFVPPRPAKGDRVGAEQRTRAARRATQAWLGVQASPTSPASVNGSISANSAEKWTQRLIASAAMPFCRAFSSSSGSARS
jgi:hypothetical protein